LSSSEKFILSYITIRGPDIESLFQTVKERKKATVDELKDLFSTTDTMRPETPMQLRDSLSFLDSVGILKINEKNKTEFVTISSGFGSTPFNLVLLNRFRLDKQNPFTLVQSYLASIDATVIDLNTLKQRVEKSIELSYTWNEEKLGFWMDLAHYLGLGRKCVSSNLFVCYPTPKLIRDVVTEYIETDSTKADFRELADYVSSSFFECFTREGLLTLGLQQTLLLLQQQGFLKLIPAPSDTPNPLLINGKSYGSVLISEVEP
jgi:uncharacterized protein YueI